MKNANIETKLSWHEVEGIIERRLEEANDWTELNDEDIAEIRLDTYQEYGWDEDPFPDSVFQPGDWRDF